MNYIEITTDTNYDKNLLNKGKKILAEYILLYEIKECILQNKPIYDIDELKKAFDLHTLNKQLNIYFRDFNYKNDEIKKLNLKQVSCLLRILIHFHIFKSMNKNQFEEFYNYLPKRSLGVVLEYKVIVNKYPEYIREKLLSNVQNVELIIDAIKKDRNINLPKNLTKEQRDKIFLDYINNKNSNPNYLEIIYTAKFNPRVDALVRLKAKKKYDKYVKKVLSGPTAIRTSIKVTIMKMNEKTVEFDTSNKQGPVMKINRDWLDSTLNDNASILQNLIYVLGFVDNDFLFTAIGKNEEERAITRTIEDRSNIDNIYPNTLLFNQRQSLYILLINAYYGYLKNNDIFLEDVLKWFFEEYLVDEFGVNGFTFKRIKINASYYEKNMQLSTTLHRLYKEYNLYCKYGKVDAELLYLDDVTPNVRELKSLGNPKYVYLNNKELIDDAGILFSDQSLFGFGVNQDSNISSCLLNGINKSRFKDLDKIYLEKLLSDDVLVEKNNFIEYKTKGIYLMLGTLFFKNTINYYHAPRFLKDIINKELKNNNLREYNFLLSKEEADYFDYYLTDHFSNGYALRNKYHHGSEDDLSEQSHKDNFMVIIYLLCLLVIKINDEFDSNFK